MPGPGPVSAAAYVEDVNQDPVLIFDGLTKSFRYPGWRLGWVVVPEDLLSAVERLAQNLFISAPNISQRSAVAAFDCHDELEANVAGYARNRELLMRELPKVGLGNLAPADGAFYIYVDIGTLTNDSADFCRRLLNETGVAVTPGIDFDAEQGATTIRISFAGPEGDIALAAARLADWLG